MKRKAVLSLLFLLLVLLVVYSMQKDPHKFSRSECPTCHEIDTSGKVLPGLTTTVTTLCLRCHTDIFTKGYIHPFDVLPGKVSVPADMTLSASGEITCSTCHDIHSSYYTPFGTSSYYLRRYEAGEMFCRICHGSSRSARHEHGGAMGKAHFTAKYEETDPWQEIDPISKECVSCHDGVFASSVTIRAGVWTHQKELMTFDKGSHPIGIDYEAARVSNRRAWLRPMSLVDPRIRFFDGKVGCGSCHNPYSNIEARLVMSDRESMLCMSCHQLDRG